MHLRFATASVLAALCAATSASAQTAPLLPDAPLRPVDAAPAEPVAIQDDFPAPDAAPPPALRPPETPFFQALGRDFRTFFTNPDAAKTVGLVGAGALFASQWDTEGARTAGTEWPDDVFDPGKLGGNFLVHAAAGGGTYLLGRASGHDRVARLGSDLLRAQILSQTVVQAAKYAIGRDRPDGSNNHSLPSGHTATAFATAGVLQRHFGWKAGIPAYAFAGYVGASRMAANRHYLSDVVLGAGVGIASAHTVTISLGAERFSLGVAPADGGAAIMFSRR